MNRDEQWLLEEKYGGKETPQFEADKERLALGEPLAHIIGWIPFLGLKIFLDSKPLIPRPETEWWTEQLIQKIESRPAGPIAIGEDAIGAFARGLAEPTSERAASASRQAIGPAGRQILDLCAGSGAIGCAMLARLPQARVYFGELNPAHKATIQKNIAENNLDASRTEVRIGDLFESFEDMRFDFIAANPPYIPEGRALPESVSAYEPGEALFSGTDGLDLIRRIAEELPRHLAPQGEAWIECDSAHAETARNLFLAQNMAAEIRNDQFGVPRLLVVSLA